jgi:hypothetical protein
MSRTRKAVASLAALNEERAELLRNLDQALLIEERYPQAFAHGNCSIRWTVSKGPGPGYKPAAITGGTLTDGAGNDYRLSPEFARELGVTVAQLEVIR